MITPGSIVRVFKQGNTAWVVDSRGFDGRWKVVSKAVDGRNRSALSSLTVAEGDIVLIKEAPTYAVGAEVRYERVDHEVIEDLGELVRLSVPASSFPLRYGGALRRPSGNSAVISKANLVLESLV